MTPSESRSVSDYVRLLLFITLIICFVYAAIVKVTHRGESETFRPEQIAAMELTYLKKVAETSLSKAVNDCVISVSWFI